MSARPPEHSNSQRLLLRGWRHVFVGQVVVTLLMLSMLRLHPALTAAATAFNLLALANTVRIHRDRVASAGRVSPKTGSDLATVAVCIVGSVLWAVALAVWPR